MSFFNQINEDRIFNKISELSNIGRLPNGGMHRLALTTEDWNAQTLVASWMEEAGMKVKRDHFGNLIGRKEGRQLELPPVMIGSHIDSVPNGGRFDGTVGVIGGIEVVQAICEAGIPHDNPIEVVAFCEEEGSRFKSGMFGSKGMVGQVNWGDLEKTDDEGVTRLQALQSFGLDPYEMEKSVRKANDIKAYLEMHIEQGPYLEDNHSPVGIVKGIAGFSWIKLTIMGKSGHAGTVPMHLRQDPMFGASEIIHEIEPIFKEDPKNTLVGTIGNITVSPGGNNVIPDSVEFMLDIRNFEADKLNKAIADIEQKVYNICKKRNLDYNFEKRFNAEPVKCSEQVVQTLDNASNKLQLNAPIMVSGAGHDAMFMADITQIGMVFVRCKDGVSHNPDEWANKNDISQGTQLLFEAVKSHIIE